MTVHKTLESFQCHCCDDRFYLHFASFVPEACNRALAVLRPFACWWHYITCGFVTKPQGFFACPIVLAEIYRRSFSLPLHRSPVSRYLPSIMSRNPLKRLSIALKFSSNGSAAVSSSNPPPIIPETHTLSEFLTSTKANYLRDIKDENVGGGEWTVSMGNEAGGE